MNRQKKACSLSGYQGRYASKEFKGNLGESEILLHTCCAPCAAGCIERLLDEEYKVILFYSNSNIFPREEYDKRLLSVERFASIYRLELMIDEYDHESWRQAVRGLEHEPEKRLYAPPFLELPADTATIEQALGWS